MESILLQKGLALFDQGWALVDLTYLCLVWGLGFVLFDFGLPTKRLRKHWKTILMFLVATGVAVAFVHFKQKDWAFVGVNYCLVLLLYHIGIKQIKKRYLSPVFLWLRGFVITKLGGTP